MNMPAQTEALRELSRAGEAYRFLLSERDLAVLVLSETIEDCNDAACRLFGVSRAEFIGRSPLEFAPPHQPDGSPSEPSARERIASALAGLAQWFTWQYRHQDGKLVDTLVHVEAVRIDGVRRVLIRIRDVSQLERAEIALKETETRLQQILDNSSTVAVFAKDLSDRYMFVNRAFERILGVPQEEIVGRTTAEVYPPDMAAELRANDLRVIHGRRKIEVEEQITGGGETRWFLTNKFLLFGRDGEPYAVCGIATDITDRKRTEEALSRAALAVSGATGKQALQDLVDALCGVLAVDVALVSVFTDPEHTRMRTLAAMLDGKQLRSYDYALAESPCAGLIGRDFRFVESGARHEIPPGTMFHAKNMDSYAAYAISDSAGVPIGLIAVMNRAPMRDAARVEALLKIFAVRAAAEIERNRTEEALRSAAVAVSSAAGEAVFTELARALATILDVEVAFIALPCPGDPSRLRMLAFYLDGRIVGEFEYSIAGTPCETVFGQEYRAYPDRLTERFPLDEEFRKMGVQSYAGFPLNDARGAPIGIISVVSRKPLGNAELTESMLKIFAARAVTEIERMRADAALRAAEASYRAIFEANEDPIFVHDWDTGAIVDVNSKACEVYGYSYEELRRITIDAVSSGEHPYTGAEAARWIERAKAEGAVEFEWHRKNRDGSLHWDEVRLKSAVIGGKRRVLSFIREITERKAAEAALRASEEQYRAIFNASDDAMVLWDSSLQRVDVNPAYERIYGFTREEVIGPGYVENLPPPYAEQRRELARRTLAGEPCNVELESVRKDGTRIQVEVRTIPIQHQGQPHVLAISRDVTARKRAEAAVRASEEQYRAIFNASVDGMLLWDADHRIVDVNEVFLEMHGYRREELLGEARPVFIPGELQAQCETLLPEILAGKPCHIEARSQRKDGKEFNVEIHGIPMRYRGQPHVLVILRDITARREAEERLRASEERYRLLFEMESDAILLVDVETLELRDANRAATELYGCSRDELLRMTATDISVEPAETASAIRGHGGTMRIPLRRHRRKDGTVFPVEISSNLLELGGRKILLAAIRDITERKRAEEKLRESEERYRLLFEMESDAIVVVDVETLQHLDVNRAAVELYGYSRQELLGLKSTDVSAEPEGTSTAMRAGGALPGTGVVRVPLRHHRKKDGTVFPVEITANFFDLDGRRIMVAAIRDITERRRAEGERGRLEAQLRQAQKMEAIGHLTGGIAHDFNNILTSILGYIVLGEERQADVGDAKLGRYLEQAKLAAQRARDLIQQMLTFSRGQRGERKALSLPPLVQESVKLLRSTLPATIELATDLAHAVPPVMMDPVQIEQVLLNLCINARDAMCGVGEIKVAVTLIDSGKATCASCRQQVAGRFVELAVYDSGPGIPADVMDRMFEPFFTTKEVGRGSGMGLAMVHGIVHDHGGHIVVDTSPETGTVFRLRFAAAGAAGAGAEPGARDGGAATRRRPQLAGRVLVVDDEQMVGEFMAELLGNWGLDVVVKRNPVEAETWFEHNPDGADLVLTDQTMPKVTGLELAGRLTAMRPGLPVILYTGYGDNITEEDLARSGVRALLRKPVEPETLLAVLRAHLPGSGVDAPGGGAPQVAGESGAKPRDVRARTTRSVPHAAPRASEPSGSAPRPKRAGKRGVRAQSAPRARKTAGKPAARRR
jgi:PAS domain S-box-containing protein